MRKWEDVVISQFGGAVKSASVTVKNAGLQTSPTIYSDNGTSTVAGSTVTADALGRYSFYVADGRYDLNISGAGITAYTESDVLIFDPNPSTGAAYIGTIQSGTGAVAETIAGYLGRLAVPATSFMTDAQRADVAAGTATLDVGAAVQLALNTGKDVYFPRGTYLSTLKLATLGNQKLFGDGKYMSIIKKGANITMLNLNDHSEIYGLGFNGVGGTYTGGGVEITTGGYQNMSSFRIYDTASNPLTFVGAQIGTVSTIGPDAFMSSTTLTNHAIVLPNDGLLAGNRLFIDIQCEGGWLIDFSAGANMNTVMGCHTIGVTYGDNSKKCALIGNRLATNDITIKGIDHVITGNTCAGKFTLAANTATCVLSGNLTNAETVDSSGVTSNSIVGGGKGSFVATFTGVVGTVTATVTYTRIDNTVTLSIPNFNGFTSNSTAKTFTGMPASIRPPNTYGTKRGVMIIQDNGTLAYGQWSLASTGVMTLYPNAALGNWTNVGTCGVLEFQISYDLV